MADTKISDLTAASTVSGADILPIVQSSTTKKATLSQVAGLASGGGTVSQVSGSDFTSSSTSLVNVTGLTFAATANHLYEVDVLLRFQNSGTNGIKFGVAYSAALATGTFIVMGNQSATASLSEMVALGVASAGNFGLVATTNFLAYLHGIVVTGANAGNITVQTSHLTSGTTTVYIGSRMTVTLLA